MSLSIVEGETPSTDTDGTEKLSSQGMNVTHDWPGTQSTASP